MEKRERKRISEIHQVMITNEKVIEIKMNAERTNERDNLQLSINRMYSMNKMKKKNMEQINILVVQ